MLAILATTLTASNYYPDIELLSDIQIIHIIFFSTWNRHVLFKNLKNEINMYCLPHACLGVTHVEQLSMMLPIHGNSGASN